MKKDDTLTLNVKVPRELHDKVDDIREMAKAKGHTYDPAPALIKALEKDLAAAFKELQDPVLPSGAAALDGGN